MLYNSLIIDNRPEWNICKRGFYCSETVLRKWRAKKKFWRAIERGRGFQHTVLLVQQAILGLGWLRLSLTEATRFMPLSEILVSNSYSKLFLLLVSSFFGVFGLLLDLLIRERESVCASGLITDTIKERDLSFESSLVEMEVVENMREEKV